MASRQTGSVAGVLPSETEPEDCDGQILVASRYFSKKTIWVAVNFTICPPSLLNAVLGTTVSHQLPSCFVSGGVVPEPFGITIDYHSAIQYSINRLWAHPSMGYTVRYRLHFAVCWFAILPGHPFAANAICLIWRSETNAANSAFVRSTLKVRFSNTTVCKGSELQKIPRLHRRFGRLA